MYIPLLHCNIQTIIICTYNTVCCDYENNTDAVGFGVDFSNCDCLLVRIFWTCTFELLVAIKRHRQ